MKDKLTKIIVPFVVILCGLYFGLKYIDNLQRDYYFLFHKKKTTADIIEIQNDRRTSCVIKLSYFNDITNKTETCNFKSDLHFGNKIQTDNPKNTDIYYTSFDPCDIYIIEYKSPTIAIIIIRVIISILICGGVIYYFFQFLKVVRELLRPT